MPELGDLIEDDEWRSLTDESKRELLHRIKYDWTLWARPDQIAPEGDWLIWLLLAGRGSGKTRTGAEYCRQFANDPKNPLCRVGVIGPTLGAVRDVCIEGESGLLAIFPEEEIENYNKSRLEIVLKNGAIFKGYSSEKPDRLRGPQHHLLWCDEIAAWEYEQETWDMAQFGLRLGRHPRSVLTTTPRPTELLKSLVERSRKPDSGVHVSRATTWANAANLPPSQLEELRERYMGTYLGMQELEGMLLDDIMGALWQRKVISEKRVRQAPPLSRVIVAIDPAISTTAKADETGIIIAGRGVDGHAYVLHDLSGRYSPDEWGRRALDALAFNAGDRLIAEANQGGDMVKHVLRTIDPQCSVKLVHASRGKITRAEPVAALYEQGKVHHVGVFPQLEDQMCTYVPTDPKRSSGSPDRMDALVWAITELLILTAAPQMIAVDRSMFSL